MPQIRIDSHFANATIRELAGKLTGREFDKAVASSLNRVASMGKTRAGRLIRNTYKIGKKDLDRNMGVTRSTRARKTAVIFAFGRPLPLGLFKPRQVKKGVSVNIMGKRRVIPHAFITTVKAGKTGQHRGVFARGRYGANGFKFRHQREGKGLQNFRGYWKNDLGITQLVTTSQAVMFANPGVMDSTLKTIEEMLPVRLEHEMSRILAGIGR